MAFSPIDNFMLPIPSAETVEPPSPFMIRRGIGLREKKSCGSGDICTLAPVSSQKGPLSYVTGVRFCSQAVYWNWLDIRLNDVSGLPFPVYRTIQVIVIIQGYPSRVFYGVCRYAGDGIIVVRFSGVGGQGHVHVCCIGTSVWPLEIDRIFVVRLSTASFSPPDEIPSLVLRLQRFSDRPPCHSSSGRNIIRSAMTMFFTIPTDNFPLRSPYWLG